MHATIRSLGMVPGNIGSEADSSLIYLDVPITTEYTRAIINATLDSSLHKVE